MASKSGTGQLKKPLAYTVCVRWGDQVLPDRSQMPSAGENVI